MRCKKELIKGFTLVELLAVIVILAIILAIAIPNISSLIDNTKLNSYNNQTKLIVNAAKNYVNFTLGGIASNTEKIITIKDLQDNNYISTNIKDQRTNSTISDKTWIVAKNINGITKYLYGYENNGLILIYDGPNNGGVGIHNDNSSPNKAIWEDLSGNNYDGFLDDFSYDNSSGWQQDSLKLDSINDTLQMDTPDNQDIILNHGLSFSITFKCNALPSADYTYFPSGYGADGHFQFGWGGLNNIIIFYGGGFNHVLHQSTAVMAANKTYNIVFSQKENFTKEVYINGELAVSANPTTYTPIRYKFRSLQYNVQAPMNSSYYSIRVYNRALTSAEILHNYEVDKLRFEQ